MKWVEKEINGFMESAYVPKDDEEFETFLKNAQKLGYNLKAVDYCSWIGIDYYGKRKICDTQLTVKEINELCQKECEKLGINHIHISILEDGIGFSIHIRINDFCWYRKSLYEKYNIKFEEHKC